MNKVVLLTASGSGMGVRKRTPYGQGDERPCPHNSFKQV